MNMILAFLLVLPVEWRLDYPEPTLAPRLDEPQTVVAQKPLVSVARFLRVNNEATAPITLAPDPDYPDPQPAAGKTAPTVAQPKKYSPPAEKNPLPIERAVMVLDCSSGQCVYVPAAKAPTQRVRPTYQRSRFRLFRRR